VGTGCLISKNVVLTSARIFCPMAMGKLTDLKWSDFIIQFYLGVNKDLQSAKWVSRATDVRMPKEFMRMYDALWRTERGSKRYQ
jgi:hypothetical protein